MKNQYLTSLTGHDGSTRSVKEHDSKIIDYKEAFSPARFVDISAIVYYLKVIPWQIPGLDLHSDAAREKMKRMHELIKSAGGFRTTQHRFFIFCRK